MEELKKGKVFQYVTSVLKSKNKKVKDMKNYKVIIDEDDFLLDNVQCADNKIIISSFVKYQTEFENKKEQLLSRYRDEQKDEVGIDADKLREDFIKRNQDEIDELQAIEKRVESMKGVYNKLFNIYKSDIDISGNEIVEITNIIHSSTEKVERELVSKNLNIEYDTKKMDIIIEINETYNLEWDMFDYDKIAAYDELKVIEKKGKVDGSELVEDVEKAYILLKHSVGDLEIQKEGRKIVSRPASLRSIISDYENIMDAIDPDEELDANQESNETENKERSKSNIQEIYFPYPANEEQKKIAQCLERENVVVQGPPGTGKTHTIVNILSYLLTSGKSVLVVSEKKDALSVIKDKLPKNLQNLTISMLGGDKKTSDETERSLKAIIENVDTYQESEIQEKINFKKTELDNIEQEISRLASLQLNSYLEENKTIKINDREMTASQWMQNLNLQHLYLQDCKTEDILITTEDLFYLKSQDKELLNNLIEFSISSNELLTEEEIRYLDKVLRKVEGISYSSLMNISIESDPIPTNLINEKLETLILQWSENKVDLELDYKEYNEYLDLETEEKKYRRSTLRNKIEIPQNFDSVKIREFLNKINSGDKLNYLQKKLFSKYEEIRVNEISILDDCNGKELILDQLKYNDIKENMQEKANYFKKLLTENISLGDVTKIFEFYFDFSNNNEVLKENGINLLQLEKEDASFDMLNTYNEILRVISLIKKLELSLKSVESQTEDENWLSSKYNGYKKDLIESNLNIEEYVDFVEEVSALEEKYYISKKINEIKLKMQEMSDSFYIKYIDGDVNADILEHWSENYIYTQIMSIGDDDYRQQIGTLKNKKMEVTKGLIELKAWKEMIKKISAPEKEAIKTWESLVSKIGKGTGKNANLYRKKALVEMKKIQSIIPIWITTRNKVPELFEFNKDQLFDVVIYDESSQSTIEALNVLERGKRKLIVGDNKQISPTSMVNSESAAQIRSNYFKALEHNIIEYNTTLFDYANAKYRSIQLKEHFRCLPELIEYSNQLQYSNSMIPLRMVNENDKLKPVVEHYYTPEGYIDNKKVNIVEANKIIDIVKEMIENPMYNDKTIGIISLLGIEQSNKINELISINFSPEIREKYNIKVGTSYEFQGDERNIILLSLTSARKEGDDEIKLTALTRDIYRQRFNVAASRARDKMVLVHSILPENIANKECLRLGILEFFINFNERQSRYNDAKRKFDSIFEEEIFIALNNRGYHVIPQYEVNRFKIDLVVEGQNGKIAVECDGEKYHGPDKFEDDMRRQQVLERAGWEFYRIRGRHYFKDKEKSINELVEYLESQDILPIHTKANVEQKED